MKLKNQEDWAKIALLVLICSCLLVQGNAQVKTFVREISFEATYFDSKLSCRAKGMRELREIILNEVGVYIENEQILETTEKDGVFTQDFSEQITTLTAGITRSKIIDETWNGKDYWLKAAITINREDFRESLQRLLTDRRQMRLFKRTQERLELVEAKLDSARKVGEQQAFIDALSENWAIIRHQNGVASLLSGDTVDALKEFNAAIDLNSKMAESYYNIGLISMQRGNLINAIQEFTAAILSGPEIVDSYYNRASCRYELEDYAGAISDINMFTQSIESDFEAFILRGNAKGKLNDYSGAVNDCTEAIKLKADDPRGYYNRGHERYKMKKYQLAKSDFLVATKFEESALIYHRIGDCEGMMQNLSEAISNYSKAITLDPSYVRSYVSRGFIHSIRGNFRKACNDWRTAASLGDVKSSQLAKKYCN